MSLDQQVAKLKGHVCVFSEELRSLIQTREMLLLAAEDVDLLSRYSGTKQARGFLVLRWSMIQECVIGITKLAYDQYPQSPTVDQMLGTILAPRATTLRDRLKADYAIPIKPAPPFGHNWTPEETQMWAEAERLEAEELRNEFDRNLERLEEQQRWFASQRSAFKDLRDKRLAHLDTSKIDQSYVLEKVVGPEWGVIKEAVQRLIEVVELLLVILHRKDESFGQFERIARQDAYDFWDVVDHG
jgi:hypothetical protein